MKTYHFHCMHTGWTDFYMKCKCCGLEQSEEPISFENAVTGLVMQDLLYKETHEQKMNRRIYEQHLERLRNSMERIYSKKD